MDLRNFNAADVDPSVAFEIVPAGWYKVVISDWAEVATKATSFLPDNQQVKRLVLTLEVIEGPHQGRKVFDGLNLNHESAETRDFAYRTLSAICHAVKVMTPVTPDDLRDKPMMAKIKVKPAQGEWPSKNEIAGYEATSAAAKATLEAAGKPVPRWPPVRQS